MPALLLVVSATAALSPSSGFVQAAEECRTRPGSTAPAGSGWYYRINRADHRHCWFLMTKGAGAHVARPRHVAAESKGGVPLEQQTSARSQEQQTSARPQEQQTGAQPQEQQARAQPQEQQPRAQPQIVSSQTELADTALPDGGTTAPQAAAPALDAATQDLLPRSIRTITFRRPSPDAQNSLQQTGETVRATAQTSARVDNSTPTLVVLAEVTATGLLFAGGGLFLAHLLRRRRLQMRGRRLQKPEVPRRAERRTAAPPPPEVPVVRAPPTASRLPNTAPIAADDLAQSIRELRLNLRRAEASIQRRFDERDFSDHAGEQSSEHTRDAFSHQMSDRGSERSLCALDESVEPRQSDG
jgi:hypothetical protein